MRCLNLGCGTRFRPDWVNLDSIAHSSGIIKHDLQKGIPFDDDSFDVVYHSHVLEHFPRAAGYQFMQECYRVLRPQGTVRVVVPDLEQITRAYLTTLEKCLAGDPIWRVNYPWMLLELLDQATRNHTGGDMLHYFSQPNIPNLDFIVGRIGSEAKYIAEMAQAQRQSSDARLQGLSWKALIRHRLWQLREFLYRLVLRSDYAALQVGRLRLSGEIHYCMYDRYSLHQLLSDCGFTDIAVCGAAQSQIPNWAALRLDTEPDGSVYKPDSLFMEAQKR
ncbi:class I SAM-dependent methyltransferase [Nodosilinea nodulosa]|uniref:class I SAM-dependent methyltransferase n=1 Tax=Nodosilinea nodulosa TaxID=416001 RepID=UPI0004745F4B|nr:methyltransferase domain-containing protein [Nodosilinea nodulosa]